jgi:hypothetical protein
MMMSKEVHTVDDVARKSTAHPPQQPAVKPSFVADFVILHEPPLSMNSRTDVPALAAAARTTKEWQYFMVAVRTQRRGRVRTCC